MPTRWNNAPLRAALLIGALAPLFENSAALADPLAFAQFGLATCRNAVIDPATIDTTAQEGGWMPIPGIAGAVRDGIRIRSAWMVQQGKDLVLIYNGTAAQIGAETSECVIAFEHVKWTHDQLIAAMSAVFSFKPKTDSRFAPGSIEMFEVESNNSASRIALELVFPGDGTIAIFSMERGAGQ